MFALNKVMLCGRTCEPAVLKATAKGVAACEFELAVPHRNGGSERTLTIGVVFWGKYAETCHRLLAEPKEVYVEGSLRRHEWTDKRSGAKLWDYHLSGEKLRLSEGGEP